MICCILFSCNKMAKFSCRSCSVDFSTKGNLNRHSRIYHKVQLTNKGHGSLKCPQCDEWLGTYFSLVDHLNRVHSYQLQCNHLSFKNETDFKLWKSNLEATTTAEFVQNSGARKCGTRYTTYYRCHRSGKFRSRGQNKRQLKNLGSNKINEVCTAFIKKVVTERSRKDIRIEVDYCETHSGHSMEAERLHLPPDLRKVLAAKLSAGVSMNQILLETNSKLVSSDNNINDKILVTRKHLHNIAASFNVNDDKTPENLVKITSYVQSLYEGDSPVILFKPKGEICEKYKDLNKNEFILGVMNDIQRFLFIQHNSNGILIDTIPRTDFQLDGIFLTSVMIPDNSLHYYPVAFLFSSSRSTEVLHAFFQEMKCHLVGVVDIKPRTFMSEDDPIYYMAWKSYFGEVEDNFISSWHTLKAWEENLHLIEDIKIREEIRLELSSLIVEEDTVTFEHLLNDSCQKWLKKRNTAAFGKYFLTNFSNRKQQWARCFRISTHDDRVDVFLANWHLQLNECGVVNGLITKRLEKCLSQLMEKFNESIRRCDFLKYRFVAYMSNTQRRHRSSHSLKVSDVYEVTPRTKWLIPSSVNDANCEYGFYQVSTNDECTNNCKFVCSECNICVHQFVCECPDRSVRFQICEHIHLLSKYLGKDHLPVHTDLILGDSQIDKSSLQRVSDCLNNEIEMQNVNAEPFQAEIKRFLGDLKLVVGESINCQSISEMQVLRVGIEKAISALETYKKSCVNNEYSIFIANSVAEETCAQQTNRPLQRILPKEMESQTNDAENRSNEAPLYFIINM